MEDERSFSQKYFWSLALAQFSYLFGLTTIHAIAWFHYLLDEEMALEWIYVGGYLYLTFTTYAQFYVSYYMDNMSTNTRLGRRKPWILIGFVILAVSVVIMCLPPNNESTTLGLWWCIFGSIGQCGADIMNLALTAWLLENTDDQEDYLRITTKIKTVSQVVGHVLALALTQYVQYGTFISSGLYCVIGATSVALIFRIAKKGVSKQVPAQPPILASVRIAVNSRLFRKLISSYTWLLAGRDVVGVSLLFLLQCEDYPEVQNYKEFAQWFVYLTLISTSIGVLSALLMSRYLKTQDKYYCYRMVIYTYITMAAIMLPCTMIRTSGSFSVIFTLVCLFAVLNTCVDILRDMMTRDLLIADYYSTGMNREAMYLTVVSTPLNVVRALISALPLLVIPLSGYHQNAAVDDDTLANKVEFSLSTLWLARLMTCAYLFFAPAALYCIVNYQITDAKIKLISTQIAEEEGEEKRKDAEIESEYRSENGDGGVVVTSSQMSLDNDLLSLTTALNHPPPPRPRMRKTSEHSDCDHNEVNNSSRLSVGHDDGDGAGSDYSDNKLNLSFHVTALSDFAVTMLAFSPVENRALALKSNSSLIAAAGSKMRGARRVEDKDKDRDSGDTAAVASTSEVLSSIARFVSAQLLLSVLASALLMALFITVTIEGHQTWAFLIVFLFLVSSMSGLYSFYRYRAMQVLSIQDPIDVFEAATDAERQRLNDKHLHVLLAEVEDAAALVEQSPARGPSSKEAGANGSNVHNDTGGDDIPNPVVVGSSSTPALPSSPPSTPSRPLSLPRRGSEEAESYEDENYARDNLLFCGAQAAVIALAATAFALRL